MLTMSNNDLTAGMYAYGQSKARELRSNAPDMTDTEITAAESYIPEWRAGIQKAGAPVRRSGLDQNYRTLQAHDSSANPNWTPEATPALFGIMHTTDPAKAKAWVAPLGTSGMYSLGECYKDSSGKVWRQIYDGGNVYDAAAMPDRWEIVEV